MSPAVTLERVETGNATSSSTPPSELPSPVPLPDSLFPAATCSMRGFASVPHRIYYEVHGSGSERLVFCMGLKNTSSSWIRQVECFGQDPRYSILVFDNRGSGHSGTPKGGWTTADFADDLVELLDFVGWTRERELHVCGTSMGGMVALQLATKIPFRIATLVLCVTSAGHGYRRKLPPLEGLEKMERYLNMLYPAEFLDAVDEDSPEGKTNRETRTAEHLERAGNTPTQTAIGHLKQLVAATTHSVSDIELDLIDALIPKIVILSSKLDKLIPPASSKNLSKHLPSGELIVWEDAGHAIHAQFPTRFNDLCRRIFQEGREKAGAPRMMRGDSLKLYSLRARENERSLPVGSAGAYTTRFGEIVDRMMNPGWSQWMSSDDKKASSPINSTSVPSTPSKRSVTTDVASASSTSQQRFHSAVEKAIHLHLRRRSGSEEDPTDLTRKNEVEENDNPHPLDPSVGRFAEIVDRVLKFRDHEHGKLALGRTEGRFRWKGNEDLQK